jgi:hypothetical protein
MTLVCACVLGIAGAGWWLGHRGEGDASVQEDAAVTARLDAASAADMPGTQPRPSRPQAFRPRADFETAPDLFVYAQRVSALARAGDADAQWMLSRVYDYCAGFAANPTAFANDTRAIAALDVSTAPAMAAARERVSQRCARFLPSDGLNRDVIQETRLRAALAGSLPAEAALLADGSPLSEEQGYRAELVRRVQASNDPQAYYALSTAMGLAASGSEAELGAVSGTWLSEIAWQMAACRLGLDCGPRGNLMTSYCAHGGICSKDPRLDFPAFVVDAGVPRQGEAELNDMVNHLLVGRRSSE